MKLTKIGIGLVFLFLIGSRTALGVEVIELKEEVTTVKKPVVTLVATATVAPTATVIPTKMPTATVTKTTKTDTETSQDDLSKWFLIATIALLTLIIVIQAWPEKQREKNN